MMTQTPRLQMFALTVLIACGLALTACETGSSTRAIEDNEGSTLTTAPGQQLNESMFLGKWDLDGERTNTINGAGGVGAIPADVVMDVLGKGWRFESGGVLRVDRAVGTARGSWKIEGADTLVTTEPSKDGSQRYTASFRDGYLYLKAADGRWYVMERSKFFGF